MPIRGEGAAATGAVEGPVDEADEFDALRTHSASRSSSASSSAFERLRRVGCATWSDPLPTTVDATTEGATLAVREEAEVAEGGTSSPPRALWSAAISNRNTLLDSLAPPLPLCPLIPIFLHHSSGVEAPELDACDLTSSRLLLLRLGNGGRCNCVVIRLAASVASGVARPDSEAEAEADADVEG